MKKIITIDAGTSNARLRYFLGEELADEIKSSNGVRVGRDTFKRELEKSLTQLLNRNSLKKEEVDLLIASGMITSSLGLYEVPHISLPVRVEDLAERIYRHEFMEMPMYLVPGLKSKRDDYAHKNLEMYDVMRGEESEIVATLETLNEGEETTLILPGSHNKIVDIAKNGSIDSFISTLSGEILATIMEGTILKQSVKGYSSELDDEFLSLGAAKVRESGITEGAFNLRCLSLHNDLTNKKKFSYLLGCIIGEDIKSMLGRGYLERRRIIVSGGGTLSRAFYKLLTDEVGSERVSLLSSERLSADGLLKLAEIKGLIK